MVKACILIPLLCLSVSCSILLPDLLDGDPRADGEFADIIVINEISADNPGTEDWIEIYNKGNAAVDLQGFFLSDDSTNPAQWRFPGGIIIAGKGYIVLYCDGTDDPGSTNFKLRPGSEELVITSPDMLTTIDWVPSIAYSGTGSYGRVTDGSTSWTLFATPTKGRANS